MVCSFMKKAVAGAALGVAALWLMSGTPAYNYIKTMCSGACDSIKQNVPVDLQVASLNQQIDELETLMRGQIQNVAREESEVKNLKGSLEKHTVALADSRKKIVALRDSIPTADSQLTADGNNREKVVRDLRNRMNAYTVLERTVETEKATLDNREKALASAKEQLAGLKDKKAELKSRLGLIATQSRANQAAQQGVQAGIDTSALTQIEKQVNDLEKQIQLDSRTIELSQQYLGTPEPVTTPAPDAANVLDEIDAKFGKVKSDDKSL